MPGPVIVDDGGSIRIRRIEGDLVGDMNDLLVIDSLSRMSDSSKIKEDFSQVLIVWQDKDGIPFSQVFPFTINVEIACHFNQKVQLKKAAGELEITVSGDAMEPMVHAKQHNKKRSYVISNSGPIERVSIDGVLVYDAEFEKGGNQTKLLQIQKPIVFTSVVLT